MLAAIARAIFGSSNDRRIKSTRPRVEAINAMENELKALSDEQLAMLLAERAEAEKDQRLRAVE